MGDAGSYIISYFVQYSASVLAWIMAHVILCFMAKIQSMEDLHAFAMVRLAAVVTKSKRLNWQYVKACGLLFKSAIACSGDIGESNKVERILNTSVQKVQTMGHSHHICKWYILKQMRSLHIKIPGDLDSL